MLAGKAFDMGKWFIRLISEALEEFLCFLFIQTESRTMITTTKFDLINFPSLFVASALI